MRRRPFFSVFAQTPGDGDNNAFQPDLTVGYSLILLSNRFQKRASDIAGLFFIGDRMLDQSVSDRFLAAVESRLVAEVSYGGCASAGELFSRTLLLTAFSERLTKSSSNVLWESLEKQIIASLEEVPMRPALFGGLAGVVFACEQAYHLWGRLPYVMMELRDLAPRLVEFGSKSSYANLDLISGASGIAVWASNSSLIDTDSLGSLNDHLCSTVRSDETGNVIFAVDEMRRKGFAGQDLGIAHGIPGLLLAVDAMAHRLREEQLITSRQFIRLGINWLLDQRNPDGYNSLFPCFTEPGNSRLGWCYGDLSVGYSLALLGLKYGSAVAFDIGLAAFDMASKRPYREHGLDDEYLCHGLAGALQMYLSLNTLTGTPRHEDTIANLGRDLNSALNSIDSTSISTDYLEGHCGIALLLLEQESQIGDFWRKPMLIGSPVL